MIAYRRRRRRRRSTFLIFCTVRALCTSSFWRCTCARLMRFMCVCVCRQPDNKTISQKTTTLKTVNMHAHIRTKHRKLESKTPRTSRLFAFARIFGCPIASAVLNWGGSYCGGHARSASCDVPHHHIKKPLKTDSDGSTSRRLSGVRAFRQRVVWRTRARPCVRIAWLNRARAAQRTPPHLYNFAHTRACDTKLR